MDRRQYEKYVDSPMRTKRIAHSIQHKCTQISNRSLLHQAGFEIYLLPTVKKSIVEETRWRDVPDHISRHIINYMIRTHFTGAEINK